MKDKLNPIDRLMYENRLELCNGCKGIDECKQPSLGLKPIIIQDELSKKYYIASTKCDKVRGEYNDQKIKDYNTFIHPMKDKLIEHIKEHKGIFLYGKVGRGKTYFLYWLANQLNQKNKSIYIGFSSDILRQIKNSFDSGEDVITQLQEVDNLFLDDFANENITEWVLTDVIFPIIDYRYKNNKPTFISSNYSLKEVFEIYKNAITKNSKLESKIAIQKVAPILSRLKVLGEIEMIGEDKRNGKSI